VWEDIQEAPGRRPSDGCAMRDFSDSESARPVFLRRPVGLRPRPR
jgi:hypothetical protein